MILPHFTDLAIIDARFAKKLLKATTEIGFVVHCQSQSTVQAISSLHGKYHDRVD
jgi:hypothetical protein